MAVMHEGVLLSPTSEKGVKMFVPVEEYSFSEVVISCGCIACGPDDVTSRWDGGTVCLDRWPDRERTKIRSVFSKSGPALSHPS